MGKVQLAWERHASVRTRPRRILGLGGDSQYFFPINEQPICLHPLVEVLGEVAQQFILIQSAYKFMADIALIETEVVNQIACKIANGRSRIQFPRPLRHDLLTVIVDEAYHAYVAIDFMDQLENSTGIAPISTIHTTGLSEAIATGLVHLAPQYHDAFSIIAVCIAENSITKELVKITKDPQVNKFFNEVNADHTVDEGRHSGIFTDVLRYLWQHLDATEKTEMQEVIPKFVREYLKPDLQKSYNEQILTALSIPEADIQKVLRDTQVSYTDENFHQINPVVHNIRQLFQKSNVAITISKEYLPQ